MNLSTPLDIVTITTFTPQEALSFTIGGGGVVLNIPNIRTFPKKDNKFIHYKYSTKIRWLIIMLGYMILRRFQPQLLLLEKFMQEARLEIWFIMMKKLLHIPFMLSKTRYSSQMEIFIPLYPQD